MNLFSQILLGAVASYVIWSLANLEANVRKARAMKVPVVRIPIDCNDVIWTIIQPVVWSVLDRLPIPWSSYPDFVRYTRRGWHFADKSQSHVRLGPVWALVTPVAIYLHFADPDAITEMFSRRNDFVRPIKEYKLLEVYGPCISTAGWDDWARHRKVLAAPFNNESIMNFVWDESLSQAQAMLQSWKGASEAGIPSVQQDTRTLSLNVLASTGFRKSYSFHGSADPAPASNDANSYRDALQTVLDNVIIMMLIPYRILSMPIMPKTWVRVGEAAKSFKQHMVKMLDDETRALKAGAPGSGRLMTSFVRSLDVHKREVSASVEAQDKKGLSVDEIFGDLFVINFAGHDTTANTLAFAMLLLAAHPEVQAWMSEEIAQVTRDMPADKWDYHILYPRLNRCRAVLLETLRLYPPIMALPKWTARKAQTLQVDGQTLVIPPGVGTVLSILALHTHPKYWDEPLTWRPARWIVNATPTADEELFVPDKIIFFPWSDGPQNCPGKKFSEVEAVAVMACLLKAHRVSVKKEAGEDEEAARKRAKACVDDVNMEMLLRMQNADRVRLVCREALI